MSENQEDNLEKALVPEEEDAAEETEKVEKPKKVKRIVAIMERDVLVQIEKVHVQKRKMTDLMISGMNTAICSFHVWKPVITVLPRPSI